MKGNVSERPARKNPSFEPESPPLLFHQVMAATRAVKKTKEPSVSATFMAVALIGVAGSPDPRGSVGAEYQTPAAAVKRAAPLFAHLEEVAEDALPGRKHAWQAPVPETSGRGIPVPPDPHLDRSGITRRGAG